MEEKIKKVDERTELKDEEVRYIIESILSFKYE